MHNIAIDMLSYL